MKRSVEILNELREISPLLTELENINVFSVPQGYFTNLPQTILSKLNNDRSISFNGIEGDSLTVPEGYFESLSSNILNKIKALQNESASEELKKLSPVLSSLQGTNVFRIPQGYFDELPGEITQIIKPQAKVISIKFKNTVWKIAVAAMMAGVIAVSSLWVSQKQIDNKIGVALNDKDIPAVAVSPSYKSEDQINEAIEKLSDDDIIKYLQTTGNAADNEFLTASIEEKELPAQQDYLLDGKTLQNYLDKIETNSSN